MILKSSKPKGMSLQCLWGKVTEANLVNLEGVEGIRSQCVNRAPVHGHAKVEVLF